jgi:hypothetical protein
MAINPKMKLLLTTPLAVLVFRLCMQHLSHIFDGESLAGPRRGRSPLRAGTSCARGSYNAEIIVASFAFIDSTNKNTLFFRLLCC